MEKIEFVKRGLYRKVARKRSPNDTLTIRLDRVHEKIANLRNIKPAKNILYEEDLRPRLRKSMLIRAVENLEKKIISSTPHPAKNNQQFFGNNVSVLLSPISKDRLSNNNKNELTNEENKYIQKDESSELLPQKDKINSRLNSPEKHNSSVICISTDNDQDRQEQQLSLRKSKKDQSTNRSKVKNKLNNDAKKGRKKNSDKSFESDDNSRTRESNKSPEKKKPRSHVKVSSAQQMDAKKSRIPLRTASQEKDRAMELNNSLVRQSKPGSCQTDTPKNGELSKKTINTREENKTPKNKKPTPRENRRSANRERSESKGTPKINKDNIQNKETDTVTEKGENLETNNQNTSVRYETRLVTRTKEIQSPNEALGSKLDELQVVLSRSSKNTPKQNEHLAGVSNENNTVSHDKNDNHTSLNSNKKRDNRSELSHHNPEFVNMTPRRRINKTQEQNHVLNKDVNIPVIITEEHSPFEKDQINKSRPSAVRCKSADRCEGGTEVFTKSIGLSPIPIIGNNKRQDTQSLQHSDLEKSSQFNLKLLNNGNDCLSPRFPRSDVASTSQNANIAQGTEDDNTYDFSKLISEISARKVESTRLPSIRPPKRIRRTVNREIQTSFVGSPMCTYAQIQRRKAKPSVVSRFTEQMTDASVKKQKQVTLFNRDTLDSNVPDQSSSSGGASDILDAAHNFEARCSEIRHNIFESLEEGNELDELNFSDSELPVTDQTLPNHPWRFVNEGLVPEKSSSVNLSFIPTENQLTRQSRLMQFVQSIQHSKGNLGDDSSDDSGHSSASPKNKTLTNSNISVDPVSRSNLNRDATLSKPGRRRYGKKSPEKKESVQAPMENVTPSSKIERTLKETDHKKLGLKNLSALNKKKKRQNAIEVQVHQEKETVSPFIKSPIEKTFVSKASMRSKKNDKSPSLESNSSLNTENIVTSSSGDKELLGRIRLSFGQSNKDIPHMHLESCDKENNNQQLEKPIEDLVNLQTTSNNKSNKTKKTNKQETNSGSDNQRRTGIDERNILQVVGGGRPQRDRRPVTFKSVISIEEAIANYLRELPKGRHKKNNNKQTGQAKKRGRPTNEKRENPPIYDMQGQSDSEHERISTLNTNTLTSTRSNVETINKTENKNIRNGPKKRGRKKKCQENEVQGENPPIHDTHADHSHIEHEIMPPPKTNSLTSARSNDDLGKNIGNIPTKARGGKKKCQENEVKVSKLWNETTPTGTRGNTDSGVDTINNTKNKNTKNTSSKIRGRNETSVENEMQDRASESFVQPSYVDHDECASFPASVTEQSLTSIRTGGVAKTHRKRNVAKDFADRMSKALERVSESSRHLEPPVTCSEQNTGLNIDGSRSDRTSFEATNNDYISYMMDGELYSIRCGNSMPLDSEYKSFGNLEVAETVKDPKKDFSAGYLRLQPGDRKRPTITAKYSFVYTVITGSARVQYQNRFSTRKQGDFFVIPVGTEYFIQNSDTQSPLVLSYTKIRAGSK